MRKIRFQNEEYIFGGESLDEAGFIAKIDDYALGNIGFGHYYPDFGISRFGMCVGGRADIEDLGPTEVDVEDPLNAIMNIMGYGGMFDMYNDTFQCPE